MPLARSLMRFSIRWFLVFTGLAALLMFAVFQALKPAPPALLVGVPAAVLRAVQTQVPGITIDTIRPETFGAEPAWAVTGTDPEGDRWILDVGTDGKMLMYEKNP